MNQTLRLANLDIDEVIANSYKNFHSKGLDYICISRTPELTVKLYFFDGDASKLPEVVNPHDHRYDFDTLCIAGEVENIWYRQDKYLGRGPFQVFDYRTPLNGGDGFTWVAETRLAERERVSFKPGGRYSMRAEELHTIRMRASETVIMLQQWVDVVPVDVPTQTFCRGFDREPPSVSGLYDEFTADEIGSRLTRLQERVGPILLPKRPVRAEVIL